MSAWAGRRAELASLDLEFDAPTIVSVWCGRPGWPAAFRFRADVPHYAASLIKLPALLAAHRGLDLDAEVAVHDEFRSAVSGTYRTERAYDNDDEPWLRLGSTAPLGWLCERMVCASSNLSTDLVLEQVGVSGAAAEAPSGMTLTRPIGDHRARRAGLTNTVTAAAAAHLLRVIAAEPSGRLLDPLRRQLYRDDIPAALPPGTRVANKNGWVDGVLHDAALIEPADAPAYVLAVCTSGLDEPDAREVIHAVTRASWADRHDLTAREAPRRR
ncbi:serine hydrolase [Streptomyces sp. DW26H14]|uniref:serine hydrolase n=1 Tax=Streptomyces sp. DW26H14 TaxID=3435395 RepID=UPI00403DE484